MGVCRMMWTLLQQIVGRIAGGARSQRDRLITGSGKASYRSRWQNARASVPPWIRRFADGRSTELCVAGLCRQEEAHEAGRIPGRDDGGGAVGGTSPAGSRSQQATCITCPGVTSQTTIVRNTKLQSRDRVDQRFPKMGLIFFIVSLVAALFGFTGISAASADWHESYFTSSSSSSWSSSSSA